MYIIDISAISLFLKTRESQLDNKLFSDIYTEFLIIAFYSSNKIVHSMP